MSSAEDPPVLSAEENFNQAASAALVTAAAGDAEGAILGLMRDLAGHRGTRRVITSQWQGDLMVAAMHPDDAPAQVIVVLDRLVRATRRVGIGDPPWPEQLTR